MTVTCNQINCFYNASGFCARECLTLRVIPNSAGITACDLYVTRNGQFNYTQEKRKQNIVILEGEIKDDSTENKEESVNIVSAEVQDQQE